MIFSRLIRTLAGGAALVSAGLGFFTLVAWALDRWRLVTLGPDYVPMAPITAVGCVFLAASLAARIVRPESRGARLVALACAILPLAIGALVAVQTWRFFPLPWDGWMLPADEPGRTIPIGRMAPLTAAALVCTALAALGGRSRLAAFAGATGLAIGAIATLGYVTGTPLHYNASIVPMALLTALAFLALNAGFLLVGPVDELRSVWHAEVAALTLPSEPRAFTRRLLISATAVGGLIVCLSFFYLRGEQADARRAAGEELAAIARLKVEQLATWRAERLAEAYFLLRTPAVTSDVVAFVRRPTDPAARAQLLGWLNAIKGGARYASVLVFDAERRLQLAIPEPGAAAPHVSGVMLSRVLAGSEPVFTDLDPGAGDAAPHLDLLVPIRPTTTAVAVIVLRLDPRQFLFPLIGSWPVPSTTAESMLVRLDANEVVVLNPLRHRSDPPLTVHRPLGDGTLLAARTARGELGVREARDYRDVPVLASVHPIPASPWILIAKIDQTEIYASVRHDAWHTAILVLVLLVAVALTGAAVWRQKRATLLHRALAAEQGRNAVAQRLALIMQHANDVILLLDDEGCIREANERALTTYGYTLEEFRALPRGGLRPASTSGDLVQQYDLLESPDGAVLETLHRRRDGSVFPVEISGRGVTIDGRRHVLGIYRDITERKNHEREIERLNRVYFVISQVNQALVRAKTREVLFAEVCRVLVEVGGFRLASIGWVNPKSQLIEPVAVAGGGHERVSALRLCVDATQPEGQSPGAVAFREGRTHVCNDFVAAPATELWRECAAAAGIQSSIALPLRCEGRTPGLLTVYAAEKNSYTPREVALLEEAAGNVSFALDVFASEARRRQTEVALRQSEERFRSIFEEAPLGVALIASLTGCIIEANAQYASIAGRTKSAMAALDGISLTHPDDVPVELAQLARMNAGQIAGYHLDKRILRPDGTYVWIHLTIARVAVEDRAAPRHLAMIQDITEAKRAEAALQQFTADLRARNETLTRFNHVAVGRELRMVELKREVNDLCSRLGEPARHRIAAPEPVVRPPAKPQA